MDDSEIATTYLCAPSSPDLATSSLSARMDVDIENPVARFPLGLSAPGPSWLMTGCHHDIPAIDAITLALNNDSAVDTNTLLLRPTGALEPRMEAKQLCVTRRRLCVSALLLALATCACLGKLSNLKSVETVARGGYVDDNSMSGTLFNFSEPQPSNFSRHVASFCFGSTVKGMDEDIGHVDVRLWMQDVLKDARPDHSGNIWFLLYTDHDWIEAQEYLGGSMANHRQLANHAVSLIRRSIFGTSHRVSISEAYTRQWHLVLAGERWTSNFDIGYRVQGEQALAKWEPNEGIEAKHCPSQPLPRLIKNLFIRFSNA